VELIEPSPAYFESYKAALKEFEARNVSGFWSLMGPPDDPEQYIATIRKYAHWSGLPEGLVPASVYWLVDGGEFIGHLSIRHALNPVLEKRGGHIGYAIRPSRENRGYGSQILKLALPRAAALGIRRALLTCDKTNAASRRIIEKNRGQLIDEIEFESRPMLRFWIELDADSGMNS
jgi:predicted acetyltransferase